MPNFDEVFINLDYMLVVPLNEWSCENEQLLKEYEQA